jgi:cytochrome c oxidase cbb3-type subunit 3
VRRAMACVLLLAFALAGCGSGSSRDDERAAARARAEARAHARRIELGRQLFAKNCTICHTLNGRHYTERPFEWEAPNLDQVRLKRRYVEFRVETGGPAMGAYFGPRSSEGKFHAIVEYLMEATGSRVVDDGNQPQDLLDQGRQVFDQNCAACHGIAGKAATGRPTYPGIDFNLVKPSERYVIARMMAGVLPEENPPLMPSFKGRLSAAEMRAVATYVTAVAKEGPEAPEPKPVE